MFPSFISNTSQRLLALAGLALLTGACAFEDGKPWGRAQFELSAAFDPPADRLDDGALLTANGYRVELESLVVHLETMELVVTPHGGTEPVDAHSHDHEEALSDPSEEFVAVQLIERDVTLTNDTVDVELAECLDDCHLERGELRAVRLRVGGLSLVGEASGEELPEPIAINVDTALDAVMSAVVEGDAEGGVALKVRLAWPAGFLDGVDFAIQPATAEEVSDSIASSDGLGVDVSRFDL